MTDHCNLPMACQTCRRDGFHFYSEETILLVRGFSRIETRLGRDIPALRRKHVLRLFAVDNIDFFDACPMPKRGPHTIAPRRCQVFLAKKTSWKFGLPAASLLGPRSVRTPQPRSVRPATVSRCWRAQRSTETVYEGPSILSSSSTTRRKRARAAVTQVQNQDCQQPERHAIGP